MVGTGCSGTDVWIGALQALTLIWLKIFGVRFEVRHAMACENVEFKQQFILAHFDPESMVPDLMALGCSSAPDIHGKLTHIQSLTMWACGIECDSISQLSRLHRGGRRSDRNYGERALGLLEEASAAALAGRERQELARQGPIHSEEQLGFIDRTV